MGAEMTEALMYDGGIGLYHLSRMCRLAPRPLVVEQILVGVAKGEIVDLKIA
jgi:hypothetical protein